MDLDEDGWIYYYQEEQESFANQWPDLMSRWGTLSVFTSLISENWFSTITMIIYCSWLPTHKWSIIINIRCSVSITVVTYGHGLSCYWTMKTIPVHALDMEVKNPFCNFISRPFLACLISHTSLSIYNRYRQLLWHSVCWLFADGSMEFIGWFSIANPIKFDIIFRPWASSSFLVFTFL